MTIKVELEIKIETPIHTGFNPEEVENIKNLTDLFNSGELVIWDKFHLTCKSYDYNSQWGEISHTFIFEGKVLPIYDKDIQKEFKDTENISG